MVGFDHERVHLSKPFHNHLCGVTEVGDKPEAARSGIKREADGIDRVVRHRKSLDKDVANLELGAGAKDSPVPTSIQRAVGKDVFRGLRVGISRQIELGAEYLPLA